MSAAVIPLSVVATKALRQDHVVMVRLLALCPMLAVSNSVTAAATLGALTMLIMATTGGAVGTLRRWIPHGVRLPIFLLIVGVFVALADMFMEATAPAMHRRLGIFLPLIITNCAVLARLEVFAQHRPPLSAAIDGAASGFGMLAAIVLLAAIRELLATGGISPWFVGTPILSAAAHPVGGFMLFGLMLAAARKLNQPVAA